jgi:hypothetical protein
MGSEKLSTLKFKIFTFVTISAPNLLPTQTSISPVGGGTQPNPTHQPPIGGVVGWVGLGPTYPRGWGVQRPGKIILELFSRWGDPNVNSAIHVDRGEGVGYIEGTTQRRMTTKPLTTH